MKQTKSEHILALAEQRGVLRPRDLDEYHIPRAYLHRLWRRGLLEHDTRGLYRIQQRELSEHHSLVEVSKQVPAGIVCLLSALQFHGLTTQNPFEIWLALSAKARRPQPAGIPLRVARFSGEALTAGIEEHVIEGIIVKVYHPAKTVADCFKYRHKIGLDVAIEALRDALRLRNAEGSLCCSVDAIWHYAQICRVSNVIKPYLEALHSGV